jgi:hypothetical protein
MKASLDLDERSRLVADLGDKFVMVLRNHGMLTCGRPSRGLQLMHNLERSCRFSSRCSRRRRDHRAIRSGSPKTASQYASYQAIETSSVPDGEWAAFKQILNAPIRFCQPEPTNARPGSAAPFLNEYNVRRRW